MVFLEIDSFKKDLANLEYTNYPSGKKIYFDDVINIIENKQNQHEIKNEANILAYLLNRKKELENLLKNETDKTIKTSLKIRWNEICKILDTINYKEPEPLLDELLETF